MCLVYIASMQCCSLWPLACSDGRMLSIGLQLTVHCLVTTHTSDPVCGGWSYSQLERLMGLCIPQLFSFCAVEDILDNFRDLFIACVDANALVYGLEHANIIADGDLKKIERNPDARQQNEILHRCLKRSCDEEALMEVCDMMIAVRGNRKMNSLGKDMKHQLQGICEHVCV